MYEISYNIGSEITTNKEKQMTKIDTENEIKEFLKKLNEKLEEKKIFSEREKSKYLGIPNSSFREWKKNPGSMPARIFLYLQKIIIKELEND